MAFITREINVETDKDSIEALWADNVASNFSDRYPWIYKKSPYGEPLTILAEDVESQTVIGCASIFPHVIIYKNKRYKYGIAYDFIVHEKHRVFGPAIKLQKQLVELALEKDYQFILGFPNKAAQGVIKRVGYSELGKANSYSKILNASGKIKNKIGAGYIGVIVSAVVNFALALFDRSKTMVLSRDYALHDVMEFDGKVDDMNLSGGIDRIEPEKNYQYLNWRYVDYMGHGYKIVRLMNEKNNKMAGYCVYYIIGTVAVIVDIKLDNLKHTYNELMVRLVMKLRNQGISSMSLMYLGDPDFLKCIKSSLFIKRPETRDCYIYMKGTFKEECGEIASNLNNWKMLDADMDL